MAQFKEIDDYNFPFEIGVLKDRSKALTFADYLNSIGIKATAKPGFGASYSIYVANESDVSKAKLELLRFGDNPFARAYNRASWTQGRTVKREKTQGSGFLSFSMGTYQWKLMSLTSITEVLCIAIYLLCLVPDMEDMFLSALAWTSVYEITGNFEIFRVITPVFLHFGIFHIAFNMVMFEAFGRPIERHFGAWKLAYIMISIAIVSNFLQVMFIPQGAVFGGMSGVVYGLIGYMGILSRREDLPDDLRLPQGLLLVSFIFIGIGFFFSGIANLCHVGGMLLGLALGFLDYRRPLNRRQSR